MTCQCQFLRALFSCTSSSSLRVCCNARHSEQICTAQDTVFNSILYTYRWITHKLIFVWKRSSTKLQQDYLLAKFPNTANNCSTHSKVVARLASELAGSFILLLKTRTPLALHPPISLFLRWAENAWWCVCSASPLSLNSVLRHCAKTRIQSLYLVLQRYRLSWFQATSYYTMSPSWLANLIYLSSYIENRVRCKGVRARVCVCVTSILR